MPHLHATTTTTPVVVVEKTVHEQQQQQQQQTRGRGAKVRRRVSRCHHRDRCRVVHRVGRENTESKRRDESFVVS